MRSSVLSLAALTLAALACNDSPTGPLRDAPAGRIVLADSVFTRGAVVRAGVGAPAGYSVVPGTASWTVVSGGVTLADVGGGDDSVDVAFTGVGPAQLRVSYTLRSEGVGSSLSIAGPARRAGGDVVVEVTRTFAVAAALLDFTAVPPASVTAGASMGNVQVAIKDVRGKIITTATDSIVLALDATSGSAGATLLGTLRARPTAGVATFVGLSIQKAGVNYRIVATSPTLASRDTATTTIVAGAPTAAQSTFAVADTIRAVGQTTTVTITLRDQYGNPVLTATPSAFTPTASAGTLGTFTCTNGVCTATYTAPNTPGTPTLGATIGGTQVTGGPQTIRVTPGPAAKLVITGDSTQAAGTSKNLTITAYDAFANVATGYAGAKSLTFGGAGSAPSGTVPTVAAANVGTAVSVTFANGVATPVASVLYKAETALLATTDGTIAAAGTDRLAVRVFAAAANAGQSTLAVADSVRLPGATTTVTVTVKDAYGNPVLDASSTSFVATASAGTLGAFTCASGLCTATYTAPATVGTQTIGVTIGGTPVGGSPRTVRVPDTTPPAITGPSGAAGAAASATSIPENTTAVHTAFTADETVTWSLSGGADAAKFVIDASTGALAFVSAPDFEAPTDAGDTPLNNTYVVIVRAVDAAGNAATQTVTVTVTNVSEVARLVITGTAAMVAGTTQTITITAVTASGQIETAYAGAKSLTVSGASIAPDNTSAPTAATVAFGGATSLTFVAGVATAAMTLYAQETAVIAATDGTIAAAGADRLTVVVSADDASPVVSILQASPSTIVADGVATSTLTVQLKDAYGNVTDKVAIPGTVVLEQTAGTGTLTGTLTSQGGGVFTQTVVSPSAAGTGTFKVRLNGVLGTAEALVTYASASGPLSRLVCVTSQPAGQNAASTATVTLCPNTSPGDLEIVTLALDGVDDITAPTATSDGSWVKISSVQQCQTPCSGGNKGMLLVNFARRYQTGLSRSVTFSGATNHKWSVDMVTFVSSLSAGFPSGADIVSASNTTGVGLASPGLTSTADNTVVYYVMANSLTGSATTPTPDGLTVLGNNNSGGTSSASFFEVVANTAVAPARTWVNTKSANTVLLQVRIRP